MSFELRKHKADAHQRHQPIVKFLAILMITTMLVTPLVTRCAGGVANVTSFLPTTSTTLKIPKVSPAKPLATAPVHSVARLNGNSSRGDAITLTFDIAVLIGAIITAGGTITAAFLTASGLITAALLNGSIPAAFINGGSLITAYIIAGLLQLVPTILFHAPGTQIVGNYRP